MQKKIHLKTNSMSEKLPLLTKLQGVSTLIQQNDLLEALRYLQTAQGSDLSNPDYRLTYFSLLSALFKKKDFQVLKDAASWFTQMAPGEGQGWHLLGVACAQLELHQEALPILLKARDMLTGNVYVLCTLGNVLVEAGNLDEGIRQYREGIRLMPEFAMLQNNLGNALLRDGKAEEALVCLNEALRLNPDYIDVYSNLGLVYSKLERFEESLENFHKALLHKPSFFEAYANMASVLCKLGRFHDAIESCQKALEINPDYAGAWSNLGDAQTHLFQLDAGLESYIQALSIKKDEQGNLNKNVFGYFFFQLNYNPDLSAETIFDAYQAFDCRFGLPYVSTHRSFDNLKNPYKKLKIGYVSAAFHKHSTQLFLEPLLAGHDRTQLEIYLYAENIESDAATLRYQSYADHWWKTAGVSDDDFAAKIRADGIDILVDLVGHCGGNRLLTFARKPAPVSLHWLDFGYTTGISAIDYYLTDEFTVPRGSEHLFAEKPWYLPNASIAYYANPDRKMGDVSALPALKNGFVTFGTLTRSIRINYKIVRTWSALLKALPNSRLVIDSGDFRYPEKCEVLLAWFQEHGIEPGRLELGFHSPPWDTLRNIDIGLDCFPHNSGTTLLETLYMGLPYVSLAGRASVGRIGGSVLHHLGRTEWIADNEEEYVRIAVNLANDLEGLSKIRSGLREELEASCLMDQPRFTNGIEEAYRKMWQKYCEDNPS